MLEKTLSWSVVASPVLPIDTSNLQWLSSASFLSAPFQEAYAFKYLSFVMDDGEACFSREGFDISVSIISFDL